jgi:hypothetical protein
MPPTEWRLNAEGSDAQARRVGHCPAFCGANDLLVIEQYGDPDKSEDVVRGFRLLIDTDAIRPAGISSTQAELMAALRRTRPVRDHLTEQGWPRPAAGVGLAPACRSRGKPPPSNPPQTQASWWVLLGTQRDSWGLGGLPQPGTGQGKTPFSQGIVRPRVPSAHLTVDPVVAGPVVLA